MTSGKELLDTASTASQSAKPSSYVVNEPLSPSRLSWLKQQQKSARDEMQRILSENDNAKVAAE